MPRRRKQHYEEIDGGKVNIGKAFKKFGKDVNKAVIKPIEKKVIKPVEKNFINPAGKAFTDMGVELGKFTNDQLLPGVVSVGIPLAGTALGALGAEFGLPPEITSSLSENLMKEYIPKQYQSKNKYVNLFGDALNMAVGGADPYSMMNFQQDLTGAVSGDLFGKNKIKNNVPTSQYYNPDNPYEDLIMQMLSSYPLSQQPIQPSQTIQTTDQQPVDTNPNDDFDARYGDSQLGNGADSIVITKSPYQQREGNVDALLGSGIKKKRRGRPPKKIKEIEEIEVYIKKKPSYKKFSHAKNSSLEQLLEANTEREEKKAREAMKTMVEKQTKALTALGFGIKPAKGSPEMKEKMARLRAMKGKK